MVKWIKRIVAIIGVAAGIILLLLIFVPASIKQDVQKSSPKSNCSEDSVYFQGKCSISSKITEVITAKLRSFDSSAGNRARTKIELGQVIGPLVRRYLNNENSYQVVILFRDAIFLRSRMMDEQGLRLVLDISYYHDKFLDTGYPELSEGLRDSIIPFIEKSPELVVKISSDKNQQSRNIIGSAFIQFIDPFSVNIKSGKIDDPRYNLEHKNLREILESEKLI